MQESFIIQLSREDVYRHLIALCQNDDLFSISDYRKDMQEQDFERIIISDAKLVAKQGNVRGAVIGTIRLLPNGDKTTAMFVDKDAIWNEAILEYGKRLFTQFFKRSKKHFRDLNLLDENPKTQNTNAAKRKSKNETRDIEKIIPSTSAQDGASKIQVTIAIIGAIAVVIAACITFMGSVIGALGPKVVDVASTAVVTTSTQRMCGLDSFTPITATPTPPSLVVIVLDTSGKYSDYSTPSVDLISNMLPTVLNAGDKVVIIQMGTGSYANAVLFERIVQPTTNPMIYLPPTQYPTLTPTVHVRITPAGGELQMAAATVTAHAQFVAAKATATEMQFMYNCALAQYKDYRIQATQYATQLERAKKDFISDLALNISTSNVTPIPNQVFESLDVAELVLDNDCSKFSQCKLVIFSDLEEWRTETPNYLSISLKKADVLSVMLNCENTFQSTCQTTQITWANIFTSLGAKTITFSGSRNAETKLIEFLRK